MLRLCQRLLRRLYGRLRPDRMAAAAKPPVPGSAIGYPSHVSAETIDASAYRAALAALQFEQRELLELHQIHGLSFTEIAEANNISAADVEREIAGALTFLAIRLEAEVTGLPIPPSD